MKGPVVIGTFKDRKENAFTTTSGGKGTHGTDASTNFYKETFDDVSRANAAPVFFRTLEER